MQMEEIRQTDIWALYDKAVSYCTQMGMYTDTDRNYRMYNGDQWFGLKVEGVEKIQYNFIKPIVRYKVGMVMTNLYAIHYSSENFENKLFRQTAARVCELLNKKAAAIWERDYMDIKLRMVVKDAAINDEGVIYVNIDENNMPTNEVLDKNDIYFGNENDSDIQSQPYILIKQRMPVSRVQEMARGNGVDKDALLYIQGDNSTLEEAGETAKFEKDEMCTVVTKLYKDGGTVHFAQATRFVEIRKDSDTGLRYYPLAHLLWEERKGSARGEGEVRHLIPNQLETNKTALRRAVTVKNTAHPQKVVNIDRVTNQAALNKVGGTVKVSGAGVDDVAKVFAYIHPAQMSPDVEKLQTELISTTRELAGAGEVATGDVNPENASGRAILAVQQAAQQPLTEHLVYTKAFVEDLARIWLDIITVYNDSVQLEEEVTDPMSGQKQLVVQKIQKRTLQQLQAAVRVDITPKGAYDKYAQEQSMENLLVNGMFASQRMPELKLYIKTLDDDSVMPKEKLERLAREWEAEQQRIAAIQARGQLMQQNVQRFLMEDPQAQARQMLDAQRGMQGA